MINFLDTKFYKGGIINISERSIIHKIEAIGP